MSSPEHLKVLTPDNGNGNGNGNGHKPLDSRLVLRPDSYHGQIVDVVTRNVETAKDWEYGDYHKKATYAAEKFISRLFNPIVYPDRGEVPKPLIGFDNLRNYNVLASYRLKRNSVGLNFQITFNTQNFVEKEGKQCWKYGDWAFYEVELHEIGHLWQQTVGKNPISLRNVYHNKEFVTEMESFGIHPELGDGHHTAPADLDKAFGIIMKEIGVSRDTVEVPEGSDIDWFKLLDWLLKGEPKPEGKSTLQKWGCCRCGLSVNATTRKDIEIYCGACERETGEKIPFIRVERRRKNSHQNRPKESE